MKILKCDLCNAIKEISASSEDKTEFFLANIKEYDGCSVGEGIVLHAHICPDCFGKIRGKTQDEETD